MTAPHNEAWRLVHLGSIGAAVVKDCFSPWIDGTGLKRAAARHHAVNYDDRYLMWAESEDQYVNAHLTRAVEREEGTRKAAAKRICVALKREVK